jgi:hypothetical protein
MREFEEWLAEEEAYWTNLGGAVARRCLDNLLIYKDK